MKQIRIILAATALLFTGCHNVNLTPEERAAILQFSLKAGDAVLAKSTK